MSCSAFTFLGAIATHYSLKIKTVEYILYALSVFFIFLAAAFEWIEEHKRLLAEVEGRESDRSTHEAGMDLLRTQRDDYAIRLGISETERVSRTNHNRPEVFANYANTLAFEEADVDSWEPDDLRAICIGAIQVDNRGGSPAFQVTLQSIITPDFRIEFSTIQRVDVGVPEYSDATLYPLHLKLTDIHISSSSLIQEDGSFLFYEATGHPLQVKIDPGLSLKVIWRNSSNNFFFSTTKNGEESPVQRMDTPLTEAEMREAYEQDEDYG